MRKTFTLACVWLWVVGVCRLSRYLPKCRYLDGKCSRLQRYDLFPFFSPPDAKTRLRRVHYGPKIAETKAVEADSGVLGFSPRPSEPVRVFIPRP